MKVKAFSGKGRNYNVQDTIQCREVREGFCMS